jgi:hypothetical protein
MKKILLILFLVGFSNLYSQSLVQTYIDRCTGEVSVFTVPMNGQTVVTFYNRSRTFTAQQFQNGTLQAWLEETYLWWSTLNPCSTATTGAVATQQQTQQTTQQAATAAANAASAAAPPPVPPPPATNTSPPPATGGATASTGTTNTSTNDTSTQNTTGGTQSSGTTDSGSSTGSTDSGSTGSTQGDSTGDSGGTTEGGTSDSKSDGGGSSKKETKTEETKTEETKTEETKSEEKTEEVKEEKKEEKKEETKEESKDEKSDESKEEDSEKKDDEEKSDDEESKDEEKDDDEKKEDDKDKKEDDKKKKKKRTLAPPIISANMLTQQSPLGGYDLAATFGVTQSSLMGDKTYGVNAMVFANGQQFMLNVNYSKVNIKTYSNSELIHGDHKHYGKGKSVSVKDSLTPHQPRVNRVYSGSIGAMKMFTTYVGMMNHSMVYLGKKGSAAGFAFGTTITSVELDIRKGLIFYDDMILGASLTGFYTKPIQYSPRVNITPMVAVSSPFISQSIYDLKNTKINTDLMFIGGSSFTYNLTQRFGFNFGVTAVTATIKDFPVLMSYMIGGRMSF